MSLPIGTVPYRAPPGTSGFDQHPLTKDVLSNLEEETQP